MIEIRFLTPRHRDGQLEWDVIATVHVEGTSFELEGDDDFAELRDIEVIDADSGRPVAFDADPERWARNLPHAFRSGDLVCEVVDDAAVRSSPPALTARA